MDPDGVKTVPLFEGLDGSQRERIARWADEVEVDQGKHLVDEGDFAHEFFVIQEGEANVTHEGAVIAKLGPGDWFGEIALEETDRRTASVVATTPMRLIVMLGRDFHEMEAEMPQVAGTIRQAITQRLANT
ncbi:MAG TPA: cyclic nucleotide-binding domain-containing protein [Longimicrobiales bacterium]